MNLRIIFIGGNLLQWVVEVEIEVDIAVASVIDIFVGGSILGRASAGFFLGVLYYTDSCRCAARSCDCETGDTIGFAIHVAPFAATKMKLAFIPIVVLLVLSIGLAGKAGRKLAAAMLLVLSVILFLVNEVVLRRNHPEFNIRVDLAFLIPLALVALSRLLFPHVERQSQTPASRQATACLTLSLVNLVAWMFPVLAIIAVVKGHKALRAGVSGVDRRKVFVGMFLGYGQIAVAVCFYFWAAMSDEVRPGMPTTNTVRWASYTLW